MPALGPAVGAGSRSRTENRCDASLACRLTIKQGQRRGAGRRGSACGSMARAERAGAPVALLSLFPSTRLCRSGAGPGRGPRALGSSFLLSIQWALTEATMVTLQASFVENLLPSDRGCDTTIWLIFTTPC